MSKFHCRFPVADILALTRFSFFLNTLKHIKQPVCALDFGTGNGWATLHLLRLGVRVHAVDVEQNRLDHLFHKAKIESIENNLTVSSPFEIPKNTFDLACSFEVLEHIKDDKFAIQTIANSLRAGGYLVGSVPEKNRAKKCGGEISKTEDGGHVRYGYTTKEMSALFSSVGIEPISYTQTDTSIERLAHKIHTALPWKTGRLSLITAACLFTFSRFIPIGGESDSLGFLAQCKISE